MNRGTNIKLRTAEGHSQSSYKGTKVAAQMRTVGREANNMALLGMIQYKLAAPVVQ
jgi:hypothetical protein